MRNYTDLLQNDKIGIKLVGTTHQHLRHASLLNDRKIILL